MNGPHLTLIEGGRDHGWQLGSVRLLIESAEGPSFVPDFQLVEDDTYRVVAAAPEFREVEEHPVRLMTELVHQEPLEPGSAHREKRRIVLVIYDLELEPICGPVAIRNALRAAIGIAQGAGAASVALPVPGRRHGRTALRTGIGLAIDALRGTPAGTLRTAVLQPQARDREQVFELLTERLGTLSRGVSR